MRSCTALILFLFSVPAVALRCEGLLDEAFKAASVVFMASVIDNDLVTTPQGAQYRRVRLRVIETWKNDGGRLDEVVYDPRSTTCWVQLKLRTTYVIFGMRYSDGTLTADQFGTTLPVYWDGECPSAGRDCPVADERAAALLSFLKAQSRH